MTIVWWAGLSGRTARKGCVRRTHPFRSVRSAKLELRRRRVGALGIRGVAHLIGERSGTLSTNKVHVDAVVVAGIDRRAVPGNVDRRCIHVRPAQVGATRTLDLVGS